MRLASLLYRGFHALACRKFGKAIANFDKEEKNMFLALCSDREKSICLKSCCEAKASDIWRVAKKAERFRRSVSLLPSCPHIRLQEEWSVGEAISAIQKADIKDCSGICYVTDCSGKLTGTVGTATLIASSKNAQLKEIISAPCSFISGSTGISDAASEAEDIFQDELPVLDDAARLMSVIRREQLIRENDKQYFRGSVFMLAKNRMLWLLLLMFSAMITGKILGRYENAFAALPILVTFIPMLTDTGGNAGSQSSTVVIRAMALGEIGTKDIGKVLIKEFLIALIVGSSLAAFNFLRLELVGNPLAIALTVSLSLYATVVISKCIGGTMPLIAKRLNMDPAMMAAPLITTVVDAVSLIIYFSIASHLLDL